MKLSRVEYIVIHCSDSAWGTAEEIDRWHKDRGFKRDPSAPGLHRHIGYHVVVCNGFPTSALAKTGTISAAWDGKIEVGREENEQGAHVVGLNDRSLGICLIGKAGHFSTKQIARAAALVSALLDKYPGAQVIGHCETPTGKRQGKTCPDLDMDDFRARVSVGHWREQVWGEYETARMAA